MTGRSIIVTSCILLTFGAGVLESGAQPAPPAGVDREITHVRGGLFRVRAAGHHSVFLVTPDGIVLTDPLSLETMQWLKEELETRFAPGIVRFVVHTRHHVDRSEGAGVVNDTAEIVGHREFNTQLGQARSRASEVHAFVRSAESHFDGSRSIALGGMTVEAVHVPLPGVPENTIVVFPTERVAFAADAPFADASPFRFGTVKPRAVNRWLAALTSLDFDVLLLGDGRSLEKTHLAKLSSYVDALVQHVAVEYEAGRSAVEFADTTLPATFRSDPMFRDWRTNVSDVHRDVALFRIDAMAGGVGNYVVRDNIYCRSTFSSCSTGGLVPAGISSMTVTIARVSFTTELTVVEELFSSRTSRFYDEEFALRETRVSGMVGYNLPAGGLTVRLLGGLSRSVADRRGVDRVKEGFAPFAGRHPIASRDSRFAITGGIDLVIGRRLGLVMPLRFNYAQEEAKETWPTRMDAQAGLAITLRLVRWIP